MSNIKRRNGFTLVELLATIAVLSVLITLVIYFSITLMDNSRNKSYQVTINNVEKVASNYIIENVSSSLWIDSNDGNYQYQCITVQDLIDAGYFKNDVLDSMVSKKAYLRADDSVYIERDVSSKTITKNVLLVGDAENYSELCDRVSVAGNITVNVKPTFWSNNKVVTIRYNLSNFDRLSNYKYSYKYILSDGTVIKDVNEKFTNASKIDTFIVEKNGTLNAKILDDSGNEVTQKNFVVNKIDNNAPIILVNSTNEIDSKQMVTLSMSDSGSGIKSYYFGKENPELTDVEWITVTEGVVEDSGPNSFMVEKEVDTSGTWYFGAMDSSGNTTITHKEFYLTTLFIKAANITSEKILTMEGKQFIIPTPDTSSGYTFKGWYTTSSYSGNAITEYKPTSDSTLYGKTETIAYTVMLDSNGGTTKGTESVKVAYGSVMPNISVPTRDGYVFDGYYSTKNAVDMSYSASSMTSTIWRVNFLKNENGWLKTTEDAGTHVQVLMMIKDTTISSAPTLDFNDVSLVDGTDYYISGTDGTWVYYIDFDITEKMVSARNYNYDTNYRFIDINYLSSNASVSVVFATKNGKKYYTNQGDGTWNYDLHDNTTLYAKWSDLESPVVSNIIYTSNLYPTKDISYYSSLTSVSGNSITSKGNDPYIVFSGLSITDVTQAIITLEEGSPINTTIQVFYATSGTSFSEANSARTSIAKGDKIVKVDLPNGTYTAIRFDFGSTTGVTFKVKGIDLVGKNVSNVNYVHADISDIGSKVSSYAVTTSSTKPSDFTDITDVNNYHVRYNASTIASETYYIWGKDVTGNVSTSLNIRGAKTLLDKMVTLGTTSYTYDGSAKQPTITVTDGATTLTKDTHYTVSYSNNTSAGTATATITGKGLYSGTITKTFTISAKAVTVTADSNSKTYDGSALTDSGCTISGQVSGHTATCAMTSESTITNAGSATNTISTVVIKNGSTDVTENYIITKKTGTLTVNKKSVAVSWGSTTSFTYNGSAHAPTASVSTGVSGEIMSVTRTTAVNAGSHTSTASCSSVSGGRVSCNNYTLTSTTKAFTISKASCTCSVSSYTTTLKYPESTSGNIVYNCGGDGTITVASNNTNVITVGSAGSSSTTLTAKGIGSSTITVSRSAGTNYNACTSDVETVSVAATQYTVAYSYNGGTKGTNAPTSGTYDSVLTINNPTKTFKVNVTNSASGKLSATSSTSAQRFAGWTYSNGTTSTAMYGTSSSVVTTAWSSSTTKVTAQYFKNLRRTSGTVTLTANWTAVNVTLPTITKGGYTCGFTATNGGTTISYASGGSYSPSTTGSSVTLYTVCVKNSATVSFKLNGSDWNDTGGLYVSLYNGTTSMYAATATSSSVTWSGVAAGTYNVYAGQSSCYMNGLVDTGIDLTVTNGTTSAGTGSATLDYYSVSTRQGTGTTLSVRFNSTSSTTGSAIASGASCDVVSGLNVWAQATANKGYSGIKLYNGSIVLRNPISAPVTASLAISSSATVSVYNIAYTLNGGNAGTNAPTSGTYSKNVTIDNPSRIGYTFKGWTYNNGDASTAKYYATSNAVTATAWSSSTTKVIATKFLNLRSSSGTVTMVANFADETAPTGTLSATSTPAVATGDGFEYVGNIMVSFDDVIEEGSGVSQYRFTFYNDQGNVVGGIATENSNYTLMNLNPGTYTIKAYIDDKAGNSSILYTTTVVINKPTKDACSFITNTADDAYLSDDLVGGIYRYQGTHEQVKNNFICFGTDSQTDCLSDPDTYDHLYRIIGFTEDCDIRVIKYYPLRDRMIYTDGSNNWANSHLKSQINGSAFLTNTSSYLPSGWSDLITESTWYYTSSGGSCSSGNGINTYNYETGLAALSAKVGVMQGYDYLLSLNNTTSAGTASVRTSWIDLYNNYYNVNSAFNADPREWVLPKRGYLTHTDGIGDGYYGCLAAIGTLTSSYGMVTGQRYVRPVFNIDSSVVFKEGIGTIDDPYVIEKTREYSVTYNSGDLIYGRGNVSSTTGGNANFTYSISNDVVTAKSGGTDSYSFIPYRVYLEKGKTYIFNATSSGTWGATSQTEAFLMLNGENNTYYHMSGNSNYSFTVSTSGVYWLRLDVNNNGETHTFSNISVSYDIGTKTIQYGTTYGTPLSVSKTGAALSGWYTSMTGGTKVESTTTMNQTNNHTLYARWTPYKVTIKYNVNGGTVTSANSSGSNTYKWTTDSSGNVYRSLNGGTSSLHGSTISYGGTLGTNGLDNWNNSTYLNITKTGYSAVEGAEWICLSGDCTVGKTYSHSTVYAASDFCDASSGDCTAVLGVNWNINKVTIQYNVNGGTVTSANSSGSNTYKWTTDSSGNVYLSANGGTSKLYTGTINYGTTSSTAGLANWDNDTYLNIKKTGYSAVEDAEWVCLSGDCTVGKTYSDSKVYAASDFCDASSGNCTAVLGVNWKENCTYLYYNGLTVTQMKEKFGENYVINPGTWAQYDITNSSGAECSNRIFKNQSSLGYLEISSSATSGSCWGRTMGWTANKISFTNYNTLKVVYSASEGKVASDGSGKGADLRTKIGIHSDPYYNAAGSGTGTYKEEGLLVGNTNGSKYTYPLDVSWITGSYRIGFVNDQTTVNSSSQQTTYIYEVMLCK